MEMDWTPAAFVIYSLWLGAISGVVGGVIGMSIMIWRSKKSVEPVECVPPSVEDYSTDPAPIENRDELEQLFRSLIKINSQIDADVGRHTVRVEELNQTLESEGSHNQELLIRTAQLLVAANRQLKSDLAVAESQLQDQRELAESFKQESRTDALTQLLNRRAFDGELNQYLAKLSKENKPFSLLLADIDHFKRINDIHGHLNGDQVLMNVANCLKSSLDLPASVSRYGGEEFAVIIPAASGKKSFQIAEHLRRAVEHLPQVVDGITVNITVSIGVTEATSGDTRFDLIERADHALFTAKDGGRNQCILMSSKSRTSMPGAPKYALEREVLV
jgi:diguanylate cyclase